MLDADPESIARCIEFIEAESKGIWHNRARAIMCRRLKHVELSNEDSERLVASILNKFETGKFAQQFKDLLKLALTLHKGATLELAATLSSDTRAYVKRQADWLIEHHSPV